MDGGVEKLCRRGVGRGGAVIGENLRPGSLWAEVELPALKANLKVTKIIKIDPATKAETVIFERRGGLK